MPPQAPCNGAKAPFCAAESNSQLASALGTLGALAALRTAGSAVTVCPNATWMHMAAPHSRPRCRLRVMIRLAKEYTLSPKRMNGLSLVGLVDAQELGKAGVRIGSRGELIDEQLGVNFSHLAGAHLVLRYRNKNQAHNQSQ